MATFKKELFQQFAKIAKAMGSGNRLEILEFLAQCEYSVENLAEAMHLSVANTSHHLQQLRHVGLVTARKEGQRVFYNLNGEEVVQLIESLRSVAERHLAEVNQLVDAYLNSKDSMEPMDRFELLQRAREGAVVVLDVRTPHEFTAGHLPNAINIPFGELAARLAELNPQQSIVAYCRGPYCVLAYDAVKLLRKKGFRAKRMKDGYPEWKSAGLPVTGASV